LKLLNYLKFSFQVSRWDTWYPTL